MSSPNLLFIFTDEQRADTMAAYGNRKIHMPNLDRLASQSCVFEHPYVTQPVCTPSRSSILTGLYPHTTGCTENNIPLRTETPCLPEMLSSRDYVTAYHGKWHLGDEIFAQHGFQEWVSIEDFYMRYYSEGRDRSARSSYHHWLLANGFAPADGETFTRNEASRLPEEFGKPAFLAREASRFIRENSRRPFALFVNFLEPHMPFFGPRDDQYDPASIPLPPNFSAFPSEDQPLKARFFHLLWRDRGISGLPLKTEADWRRLIANYWGLCSLVDTHVGTILETLEDCGLAEDTIVVFTSDHGDMMGSHRLLAKCVMFQEAVRVPLIIRLPGQRRPKRIAGPVSQIDLVPTLLDLMGQPIPPHLQGKSLAPLLGSSSPQTSEDIFIEWNGPNTEAGSAVGRVNMLDFASRIAPPEEIEEARRDPVRTVITPDGWKFNCSPLGEHELYNLNDDPLEITNLACKSDLRPLMEQLAERIRAWQRRAQDAAQIPSPLFGS